MSNFNRDDFNPRKLYDIYYVKLHAVDRICGGRPKNPELIRSWVESTTGHKDDQSEALTKQALEELVDETTEKSWNGFPGDAHGIFLAARQIKALFKECATMRRVTVDKRGSKQIFQHGFEIKATPEQEKMTGHADRIYMTFDGEVVKESHGFDEGPIHVQTPQGPRTALKRVDYVEDVDIEFEIWVMGTASAETRHVGEVEIIDMLTFGQENGLGADRSQGHGKFRVVDFHVVQKAALKKKAAADEETSAEKKPAKKNAASKSASADAE